MELNPTPPLDLSPRAPDPERRPRRGRRLPLVAVAVLLVAGGGFLVSRALTDATLFFLNADEAVAQRDSLGSDRFRLQGSVVPGSAEATSDGVSFVVTYNGVEVDVRHQGDPPELFSDGIPVVLEGHWEGVTFSSDRMLVKHDETYVEESGERLDEAEHGGQVGEPAEP